MILKTLRKIKQETVCPPKVGEIVEGKIIEKSRNALYLDLGPKGIGVILGREFFQAKDMLKDFNQEDSVFTKVVGLETADGFRELSFLEANQEIAWQELEKLKETGEHFEAQIKGANKGGLLLQIKGIPAFLPTSQLLPEHFPKVKGADPARIAQELQKIVGQKIKVKIFDVDKKNKKLIISEKATRQEKVQENLKNYQVGDMVDAEITGITSFGAFVKFGEEGEESEGLVHSSEIPEGESLQSGQKTKAKIINLENNKAYLSFKL